MVTQKLATKRQHTKTAYLTIDDAPSSDLQAKTDFLTMAGIPAVFFCIGSQVTPDREESVREAIRRGFLIGNHSWSHPSFETLAIEEATDEITRTEQIIERLYHEASVPRPIRLFRFPYLNKGGRHREALQELLRKMGFRQPHFENLTLTPFDEQPGDVDVSCTYDTMDWTVAKGIGFRRPSED